ncbi:helix-turn-helix domain-containing protein [Streptomyces nigra]|uniref:helix-turn-helix domain-containing protein n=1 Tax=Streptomyces nigra TaxID=1827580 RepID=UPI0030D19569
MKREESPDIQAEVLRMRAAGSSYSHIARRLNISKSTAHGIVQSAYATVTHDLGPVALALELERLDEDLAALSAAKAKALRALSAVPVADEDGDGSGVDRLATAVTTLTKITEARGRVGDRRARLRGLEAPTTVRLEAGTGPTVGEILDRVADAVRPFPDAAAAVSMLLLDIAEAMDGEATAP